MRRWLYRHMVKKLFDDLAPRFAEREGGYTRILKLGSRKGGLRARQGPSAAGDEK